MYMYEYMCFDIHVHIIWYNYSILCRDNKWDGYVCVSYTHTGMHAWGDLISNIHVYMYISFGIFGI